MTVTSYSTFGTSRIRLVDGTLSFEDDERRANEIHMITQALASGAARALLDTCHDVNDSPDANEQTEIYAEEWHSEAEGWELGALTDESRAMLEKTVELFVAEYLNDILTLSERIAWDSRFGTGTFAGDQGMGLYRVGNLLGYTLARSGIGFEDYSAPSDNIGWEHKANGRTYRGLTGRLALWADEHQEYGYEDAWIDSTEEPCLLHLTSH